MSKEQLNSNIIEAGLARLDNIGIALLSIQRRILH